ncbi:hypothetical protein [Sphingomonas prati]|uniref:Uncharacterized protein n=2 Tax=Sphingomonas prati TaxID=1843237 RepID=A0A7W9BRC3_9SPHN|nr:hypothetical protein [Sphingomonas prati]MBB5728721.1 hypothetical protein [Sphingomonas prati]GGE71626.1 hypothetical protein GCM10011404_00090 [Sphingomonas prati]
MAYVAFAENDTVAALPDWPTARRPITALPTGHALARVKPAPDRHTSEATPPARGTSRATHVATTRASVAKGLPFAAALTLAIKHVAEWLGGDWLIATVLVLVLALFLVPFAPRSMGDARRPQRR